MSLTIAAEAPPLTVLENGAIRVTGTRMPLEVLIHSYVDWRWSAEKIAEQYDTLTLADVYAVLAYYHRHRPEVEAYIAAEDEKAEALKREIRASQRPPPTRTELLQRRAFRVGERVLASGVWRLQGTPTELLLESGTLFPSCPGCDTAAWEFVSDASLAAAS